jgi:hypothetical protein
VICDGLVILYDIVLLNVVCKTANDSLRCI